MAKKIKAQKVEAQKSSNKEKSLKSVKSAKTSVKTSAAKTSAKTTVKAAVTTAASTLAISNWNDSFQFKKATSIGAKPGFLYVLGENAKKHFEKIIRSHALEFIKKDSLSNQREVLHFTGKKGLVWIYRPELKKHISSHQGFFAESDYTSGREVSGGIVSLTKAFHLTDLHIEFIDTNDQQELGVLVGLGMGAYQYRAFAEGQKPFAGLPRVHVTKVLGRQSEKVNSQVIAKSSVLVHSVNTARHLINLPANELNPSTYAEFIQQMFNDSKNMKVDVWDYKRLQNEGMGLITAVGKGSEHKPCLVHLKYRPDGADKKISPIVFVGKGITFDTGGNDIKPSSAMRLMKKDMGGSAAVTGLAMYIDQMNLNRPYDFYLAIAENSVDGTSFRPGDVYKAKNGMTVEISNTDAEGRLVLADALDVAINQNEKPLCVIDLATLTGAIKVALGADIAGLFSNNDDLSEMLVESGLAFGDLSWRMPLVAKYNGQLNSAVASMQNSAEGGFGGAITAALFLEKFVGSVPWAHFDIYSWNDKAGGPLSFVGGSGQGVQALIGFIDNAEKNLDLKF